MTNRKRSEIERGPRSLGLNDKSSDIPEGRDPLPDYWPGICIGEILTLRLVASGRSYRSVVQFSDHLSHDYPGSRLREGSLSFSFLGNGTLAPRHNPLRPLSLSLSCWTRRPVVALSVYDKLMVFQGSSLTRSHENSNRQLPRYYLRPTIRVGPRSRDSNVTFLPPRRNAEVRGFQAADVAERRRLSILGSI